MGVYDDLGVARIINGYATLTSLGGSLMPPEVTAAMAEAARSFVDIDDLQVKVGRRIAAWTHNEAAYVSSGAAAGLVLSTAACIAGLDEANRARLPSSEGMKNRILLHRKGRVGYDFAIRQAGGVLVEVGDDSGASVEALEDSFTGRTAALFYFYNANTMPGQVPVEVGIEIAHAKGVPVIVDAAAQLPPVDNLWRFTRMGADLVLFSGGKGLCGPQASGLVLGRQHLIDACAFHACPRPFIGRPMKAGKEEIIGLMTALRWYLDLDHEALAASYEDCVAFFIEGLSGTPALVAERNFPSEAGQPMPRAKITIVGGEPERDRNEILRSLREGTPPIALAPAGTNGIYINPQVLAPGEKEIVLERLLASAGRLS